MVNQVAGVVYRPPIREMLALQLRADADSSARMGDRSVRDHSWEVAKAAYSTARDLNTAARQVELNLEISNRYRAMVRQVQARVMEGVDR